MIRIQARSNMDYQDCQWIRRKHTYKKQLLNKIKLPSGEQCEVEYDSDEDADNVNLPKTDSTVAAKTETINTSKSDNSKLNDTHEQVKQVSSNESSSERLRTHPDALSAALKLNVLIKERSR